jgi:hypothetical protein
MDVNAQRALVPMYEYVEKSEDELYRELGLMKRAISNDCKGSDNFAMKVHYVAETFGPADRLKEIGQEYFARVSQRAFAIVCGVGSEDAEERKLVQNAFQAGMQAVAAATAAALVSALGMAPALAAVVGALVVKIFYDPAYETMCHQWKTHLPAIRD